MILPLVIIVVMTPDELKRWRELNDYTQQELATALGTYQVSVARWETGARKIPSFLHLALRCLELEGGESKEGKQKNKGGVKNG